MFLADRREKRSARPFVALRYQLEHTQREGRMEALVLADDRGIAIAASGDPAVCNELASVAPFVSTSPFRIPMPPLLRGADLVVRTLSVHGRRMHLAAVGGSVARDAWLSRSASGVERIMTRN